MKVVIVKEKAVVSQLRLKLKPSKMFSKFVAFEYSRVSLHDLEMSILVIKITKMITQACKPLDTIFFLSVYPHHLWLEEDAELTFFF